MLWNHILLLQVTELKKKQRVQSQLSTKRPKGNEATRRLQFEIQSLKAQKVPYVVDELVYTNCCSFHGLQN